MSLTCIYCGEEDELNEDMVCSLCEEEEMNCEAQYQDEMGHMIADTNEE